jgi:hypothetical protein
MKIKISSILLIVTSFIVCCAKWVYHSCTSELDAIVRILVRECLNNTFSVQYSIRKYNTGKPTIAKIDLWNLTERAAHCLFSGFGFLSLLSSFIEFVRYFWMEKTTKACMTLFLLTQSPLINLMKNCGSIF